MLPMHNAHPRGWTNPVNARAVAVPLPAAPNWDVAPTEFFASGAQHMTLAFTYTRGAAGGAFDFQIHTSIYSLAANAPFGAAEWHAESLYVAGALIPGADVSSNIQRDQQTYQATSANAETFTFGPFLLGGTIERVRVTARESGAIANPGTLQITAELWG